MSRVSYSIFIPSRDKSKLSNNQVIYSLWLAGFALVWSTSALNFQYLSSFVLCYLGVLGLVSCYFAITSFWHYRPFYGQFKGEIEFTEKAIIIDGKTVPLDEIQQVKFSVGDYAGKDVGKSRYDFNPRLSSGIANHIEIRTFEGDETKVYFKLDYSNHEEKLYPFITKAIQLNKLSFLVGMNLLKITDYDEIQAFKKHHCQQY